jgi:uncharacterized membrane protein YfcA
MTLVLLSLAAGGAVGLVLGLVGAGGSILAVPLLVHVVGLPSAHAAIGTAAVAVALNAGLALAQHARQGLVKWRCAGVFTVLAVTGAWLGAAIGQRVDSDALLALFGGLMVVVGAAMLRPRPDGGEPDVRLTADSAPRLLPRLVPGGFGVGALSGFFGIGGGFLIVPSLVAATRMPMRNAVSTSLVAVTALGMTTALSYARAGLVDWAVAGLLVAGGIAGSAAGLAAGRRLSLRRGLLQTGFAAAVTGLGLWLVWNGLAAWSPT